MWINHNFYSVPNLGDIVGTAVPAPPRNKAVVLDTVAAVDSLLVALGTAVSQIALPLGIAVEQGHSPRSPVDTTSSIWYRL